MVEIIHALKKLCDELEKGEASAREKGWISLEDVKKQLACEKQDFMNILFGIRITSKETDDYWGE